LDKDNKTSWISLKWPAEDFLSNLLTSALEAGSGLL